VIYATKLLTYEDEFNFSESYLIFNAVVQKGRGCNTIQKLFY